MKTAGPRISAMVLALTVAVAITTVPGQAQRNGDRQSGPRDWSHGRVVATRFGPDQDKKLNRDFRTFLKHAQLEQAETRRSARVASGETLQRLEMEQRQASINLGMVQDRAAAAGTGTEPSGQRPAGLVQVPAETRK